MRLAPLALVPVLAVVLAACSSSGGAGPSSSASASVAPSSTAVPTHIAIEVSLTDALKIEPASMTVPAGVPITFVVTNSGTVDHEFYLGDEEAQAEHEQEMADKGGMTHDEPEGIAVKPGETKELTYTFAESGETLAGCHEVGHYGGGMKATIKVEG